MWLQFAPGRQAGGSRYPRDLALLEDLTGGRATKMIPSSSSFSVSRLSCPPPLQTPEVKITAAGQGQELKWDWPAQ